VDADTLDSKLPARTTITQTQLSMYSAPFTARTGGFSFGGFCYLWQGKREQTAQHKQRHRSAQSAVGHAVFNATPIVNVR
jgi:hypothetical protein